MISQSESQSESKSRKLEPRQSNADGREHRDGSDGLNSAALFEPLLDSVQAARLLRIHPKTVRAKARNGEIPAIRVGRVWRFRASSLDEWITQIAS